MVVLYTDGGCSGNGQYDISKRKMVVVVSDEHGQVLIEKHELGGSNNIAELIAVKEALQWAFEHDIKEVEIRTDSTNNKAWVFGRTVGKKINDRELVLRLKAEIRAFRDEVELTLSWIPRAENLAGHYIEKKYAS